MQNEKTGHHTSKIKKDQQIEAGTKNADHHNNKQQKAYSIIIGSSVIHWTRSRTFKDYVPYLK